MDFKRNALFVGLAVISYLMLLAWNEDYPAQAPANSTATSTVATIDYTNSDLPSPSQTDNADLPQVEASTPSNTRENSNNSSNLITIDTPVHRVSIDLLGGDIVSLSLPKYPAALETPDQPFTLLKNDNTGIYISQSGLIGLNGPDASDSGRPLYQSTQASYSLSENDKELSIDLNFTDTNNVLITKRFTFSPNDYLIKVQYIIKNQSQDNWNANLFGQIKRDRAEDPSSAGGVGMKTYLGAALTTDNDPYKRIDFDDIDDNSSSENVVGGWIAFSQHYFISSWIPDGESLNTYTTRKNNKGEYILGFVSPETSVSSGTTKTIDSSFWAGPKDQYRLEEISENLGLTIDYGFLWFIAQPIFWLLVQVNDLFGNYGWSIIGMTVIIKLLFSKLSASSYRSMAKMRRLAPKIAQLKDRYGDDKQKIMQEQMALWKKEKVNPLGGCLPMLLQMPVLMGIYWVLNESVELRQAPFILWYTDLSIMDPYFILPLIMGASMFISQTMTPMTTADPMQAKIMKFMPVVFTVFFLWFPSGLVLYWLVSNVFNISQQWYINKKVNSEYENKSK